MLNISFRSACCSLVYRPYSDKGCSGNETIVSVPSYSFLAVMSLTFVLTVKEKENSLESFTFFASLVE